MVRPTVYGHMVNTVICSLLEKPRDTRAWGLVRTSKAGSDARDAHVLALRDARESCYQSAANSKKPRHNRKADVWKINPNLDRESPSNLKTADFTNNTYSDKR